MTAYRSIPGRIVRGIRAAVACVVILCFVYMTLAVLAQIFGRYVFNYSVSWTEETARFAQIWVVLVGAGITMRRGMHVAVDVLASMLPPRPARVLSLLIAGGSLWFLAVVTYGSLSLIELGWLLERSSSLHLPMWIIYLALPLGAFYWGFEIVLYVAERWDHPFRQRSAADADSAS